MIWHTLAKRFGNTRPEHEEQPDRDVLKAFRKRYARFRRLLDANAALAGLMADMEEKLSGKSLYGMLYVRRAAGQALEKTYQMARSLDAMSGGGYAGLIRAVDRMEEALRSLLEKDKSKGELLPALTLPLSELNLDRLDDVGGKNASLGEMLNRAGVPVPRGFAVTVSAFRLFMAHEGLGKRVEDLMAEMQAQDREGLSDTLAKVRALIEKAPLPEALEQAFASAMQACFAEEPVRLAARSSAQAEDGNKSFAGQFLTLLGVRREDFPAAYRKVVASLFTPSATLYRLHQGIPLSANAMAVSCIEMVDALASGVAYSHDPINLLQDTQIINGVWGLGRYIVDGLVEPDSWVFTRQEKPELVRRRAGSKERQLRIGPDGELTERPVAEQDRRRFCLSDAEAQDLAAHVLRLERHYGGHQDVEWAKARDGKLIFLQSRPLDTLFGAARPKPALITSHALLLEGGDIAYPGIGCGPVVMPHSPEDLLAFPEGGVLVAAHSNAEYAAVLDKAQAVVTATGGLTGHMATICREFRVPTLLNAREAMRILKPGMEVTVDAFSARVYQGKVEELLPLRLRLDPVRLQDTPVHAALREVSRLILPLNLTDTASARFSPEGCQTLHDVMRFAHERSYQEMFAISDSATEAGSVALKLAAPLPIDLYIIDLDKGAALRQGSRSIRPEEILCAPLKALLGGMLRPEVMFRRPRPVNMGGFFSVMGQQMLSPQGGDGRFGDKSYAIISDRYMNFSSRVGYHYSVLDSYCGMTDSKNYISFSFQGGAAGEDRRARRIRAIALVLEELGFSVAVQGDMLKSRFQKYPKSEIENRLDQLGRLLQVTRQMDMLMTGDEAVTRFRDDFMQGAYY